MKALLAAGEHPHVDYKQVLPRQGDFAKAVCAAANTAAVRPDIDEFVSFVGVKEAVGTAGVVSGEVTGLLDPGSGQVRDIETEKLTIVNASREIEPSPDVEIDECGVGTATPFLAVRVRPTEAPHRLGDRYPMRRGSHTVPLESHHLRRIFVEARNQAFIDEINEDNHLTRAMRVILAEVENLSQEVSRVEFAVTDEADERRRSAEALERFIEHSNEELLTHLPTAEEMGDLSGELSVVAASVDGLYQHITESTAQLDGLRSNLTVPIAETARSEVISSRETNWAILCSWYRRGEITPATWTATAALFEAFFFDVVSADDPSALLAEYFGWRGKPDDSPRTGHIDLILYRACNAALGARLRDRSGPAWMRSELDGSRFDRHSWWVAIANRHEVAHPASNPRWHDEAAVLLVNPSRLRSHVEALGAVPLDLADDLLVFRLSDCRIEMRTSHAVTALMLRPNPPDDRFPDSRDFLRELRRRLKRAGAEVVRGLPGSGGQLAPLAGERRRAD